MIKAVRKRMVTIAPGPQSLFAAAETVSQRYDTTAQFLYRESVDYKVILSGPCVPAVSPDSRQVLALISLNISA